MNDPHIPQDSRERVLSVAEKLFTEKGYAAVTLRDIAQALNIKQASLYYHAPAGKEALFVEAMERSFQRHRDGLQRALDETPQDLRAQMLAVARWFFSQPMTNFARLMQSDMPAISQAHALRLSQAAREALILPIQGVFERAGVAHSAIVAGMYLSVVEGIHSLPTAYSDIPKESLAEIIVDYLLHGLLELKNDSV